MGKWFLIGLAVQGESLSDGLVNARLPHRRFHPMDLSDGVTDGGATHGGCYGRKHENDREYSGGVLHGFAYHL
jgi:hypothetical protein